MGSGNPEIIEMWFLPPEDSWPVCRDDRHGQSIILYCLLLCGGGMGQSCQNTEELLLLPRQQQVC